MGLKSCPMCDSERITIVKNESRDIISVGCTDCGTRTGDYLVETEAIGTWNMRKREDKVWGRIEKFRESLNPENHYDPALNN